MLSYINKFAVFIFSYFVFFSCNGSPIYLKNQSYLDAIKALAHEGYALRLELLPKSYAHQQAMNSSTQNINLFKGEYHGMRYSVDTTPLSMVYLMRDICRFIFKPYGNIPHYREVDRWRDYFIKRLKLETPTNFAPDTYYATFTADVRKEILHYYGFYDNPAFIEFIKTFPEYEQHILASHTAKDFINDQLKKMGNLPKKSIDHIMNDILPDLAQKVLVDQQERMQASEAERLEHIIERRESQAQKQALQARYEFQDHIIQNASGVPAVLHERNGAIAETLKYDKDSSLETVNTPIDTKSVQLLQQVHVPREFFETCVGNKTQQQLHKEFGSLLKEASAVTAKDVQFALTHQIVTGQELNHLGYVNEAYAVADFCHAVLDFTKGVGKGVWHSLCAVGNSVIHPIETITSVGKGVVNLGDLIYQMIQFNFYLLKVNLKNYIEPFYILHTYYTKGRGPALELMREIMKEHEARDAVYDAVYEKFKEGINSLTAEKAGEEIGKFVTDIYLFGRISKAASNFSKFTKLRLLKVHEKISKSGSTAEKIVLATAEGVEVASSVEKITQEAQILQKTAQVAAKNVEQAVEKGAIISTDAAKTAEKISHSCPASCTVQYSKMTQSLLEEQFESIIKCTKHGIQRLIERGFTPDEVLSLITKPDFVRMQKDGAKAFIKQIGEKYSVIIINEATGEVVTGLKGTTVKKIIALGKNYGWTL